MERLKLERLSGTDEGWKALWIAVMLATMIAALVLPVGTMFRFAFLDAQGQAAGLSNIIGYLQTPALLRSLGNTFIVAGGTTVIAVALALGYAYAYARTGIRGKRLYKYIAMLPLFAPTMMHGIGLVYLFGNQGLITTGFFGWIPFSWKMELYGPVGIILAEVVYVFPQAFLLIAVAMSSADGRLYEAAESMGAGPVRRFFQVTLPGAKYGILSAIFVCFTLSFTDFGAPKVVGGQYNVLATDIYKQVIGQQNFVMGAVVGIVLTLPAAIAFVADRVLMRKQQAYASAKAVPYRIRRHPWRDAAAHVFCAAVSGGMLLLMGAVVLASFIKVWPYNLTWTLDHYDFSNVAGEGLGPYGNSVRIAIYTAVAGTLVTFFFAYLIEKTRPWPVLRQTGYFFSILPMALPGMVIGLSYIFFFNRADNPLHGIYGTAAIIVLANIVHFYAVPFLTATTALKKLDREIESAAESMSVPFYRTLLRVTVPMTLPAMLEMAVYFFVNAMVTISAVVFLYSADLKLASVTIVNMDDAGDVAPAAAMSVLIVATNIGVRLLYEACTAGLMRRAGAWQRRD